LFLSQKTRRIPSNEETCKKCLHICLNLFWFKRWDSPHKKIQLYSFLNFCNQNTQIHRLGQAKFAYGGLVLGSSQFTILPQLPLKTMLSLKMVKIYLKIIITLPIRDLGKLNWFKTEDNFRQRPGVNFINVLWAAFGRAYPGSVKKTDNLIVFFALLGSARVKTACKTLMNQPQVAEKCFAHFKSVQKWHKNNHLDTFSKL